MELSYYVPGFFYVVYILLTVVLRLSQLYAN